MTSQENNGTIKPLIKIIISFILIISIFTSFGMTIADYEGNEEYESYIIPLENEFNYKLDELSTHMKNSSMSYKAIMLEAHEIAQEARGFGYKEDSIIISEAKKIWHTAEDIINQENFVDKIFIDVYIDEILTTVEIGVPITLSDSSVVYYAKDGSTYTFNDMMRVAGLDNHEPAPNPYDMFMTPTAFVNRWHLGYWGTTTTSVLAARGQYYNENYDSKHQRFINNAIANGWNENNNIYFYIANLCLSGYFTVPSNVYGQSAYKQGQLYMYVDNKTLCNNRGYYNHQYCTMFGGEAISETDWSGAPAINADEACKLIEKLSVRNPINPIPNEEMLANGIVNEGNVPLR